MTRRRALVAIHCRASELEQRLAESVDALEDGARFVDPAVLPTADQLAVTHGTPFTLTAKAWHELGGRGCG